MARYLWTVPALRIERDPSFRREFSAYMGIRKS